MALAAKMDEIGGRGGWIAAMILAFLLNWQIGLAVLAFLVLTGRLRGCRSSAPGRWYNQAMQQSRCGWNWNWGGGAAARPSGNRAFDEYRAETLRRLEEEQKEFVDYLERLRQAKDKAEFDEFMAERRRRTTPMDPNAEAG